MQEIAKSPASASLAPLGPSAYTSDSYFLAEQAWLLANCWHFVCLSREISGPNGYATIDLGGASVTVENTRDGLMAFRNVCSHRGARLRRARIGAEPLVCPYHGWRYNESGVPSRIPFNDTCFGLSEGERARLALPQYRVAKCGEFVFVAAKEVLPSLVDYLGRDVADILEKLSEGFESDVRREEIHAEANWKVLAENAMDPIHSPFVHKETFGAIATIEVEDRMHGMHSLYLGKMKSEYLKRFARVERLIANRPFRVDGYLHLHVFPLLSIGSNMGMTCMVQSFAPGSASGTTLLNRYIDMRLTPTGERVGPHIGAMRHLVNRFNTEIGLEDRRVAEDVQRGLSDPLATRAVLGTSEARIRHFQNVCAGATSTA
jgi:phenylpropionate dioxygenase-like ring-hydroxylating dioxygenase large terminal subunit